jgi:hypothetical protein
MGEHPLCPGVSHCAHVVWLDGCFSTAPLLPFLACELIKKRKNGIALGW